MPGFDGGMEQVFHVVVQDRTTGKVHYNESTRKPDLFIQSLIEGSSYLTSVTPINNKGSGKSTHVIVDTLRHPAVELTQAEGGGVDTGVNGGMVTKKDDDWAVLMGTLVGTLGCLTILVVASLVIRFCVCPANRNAANAAHAAAFAKSDLPSPLPPSVGEEDIFEDVDSAGGGGSLLPMDHLAIGLKPSSSTARKGILKHPSTVDPDFAFMEGTDELLPPPNFSGNSILDQRG